LKKSVGKFAHSLPTLFLKTVGKLWASVGKCFWFFLNVSFFKKRTFFSQMWLEVSLASQFVC